MTVESKTKAIQNIAALFPDGCNMVVGGELVRGEITPTMAAMIAARKRLDELGPDATEEQIEELLKPVQEAMGRTV